jgi:hypothetical protein
MPLYYSLRDNKLTPDPNDFMAQTEHGRTVTMEELIRQRMARSGSTITVAEALANWEELSQAIIEELQNGNRVNTNLVLFSTSITGVFTSETDAWDPARHHVRMRLSPGVLLRKAEAEIKAERIRGGSALPLPLRLEDFSSDTANDQLTPGGTARLTGELLKFDPTDELAGLYLRKSTGATTKVSRVMTNTAKQLLFMVPTGLAAGSYTVLVRSRFKATRDSQIKEGALSAPLTVA